MKYVLLIIVIIYALYFFVKILYFNRKFKRYSKYACFVVVSQDGFISKPMYYDDAKKYSDSIYGTIFVDRDDFNRIKIFKSK
jgi:hypothetical protein